jgi:competence protein ComEC
LWSSAALVSFWPQTKIILFIALLFLAILARRKVISLLILAALVGVVLVGFRQAALNNQFLLSKIDSHVVAEGVVLSDPILKTGQVIGSYRKPDQNSALFKLLDIDGTRVDLPLRIRFASSEKIEIDQRISMRMYLVKSKERKVAALGIVTGEISIKRVERKLFKVTSIIRDKFRNLTPSNQAGALIPGLVLGDTSLQSALFTEQMRWAVTFNRCKRCKFCTRGHLSFLASTVCHQKT